MSLTLRRTCLCLIVGVVCVPPSARAADPVFNDMKDFPDEVWALAFTPDGKTLAVGIDYRGDRRGGLSLWDVQTRKIRATLEGHNGCYSMAVARDGSFLVANGFEERGVCVWDLKTLKPRLTIRPETQGAGHIALSPDDKVIAVSRLSDTALLYDAATGKPKRELNGSKGATGLTFAPDGKTVAGVIGRTTLTVWDAATGNVRVSADTKAKCLAFSRDGKTLFTGDHDWKLRSWDPTTCKMTKEQEISISREVRVRPEQIAASPDGRLLAIVGGWQVVFMDVKTQKILNDFDRTDKGGQRRCLAFSADSWLLATGSGGGRNTVRMWFVPPVPTPYE